MRVEYHTVADALVMLGQQWGEGFVEVSSELLVG